MHRLLTHRACCVFTARRTRDSDMRMLHMGLQCKAVREGQFDAPARARDAVDFDLARAHGSAWND
jgi:hypothetical protein